MMVHIKNNGATDILICVPKEAVEALGGVVGLFENNAQFIVDGYSERRIAKPNMTIELGNSYEFPEDTGYSKKEKLVVCAPGSVSLSKEYVAATPEVFLETKNIKAAYAKELQAAKEEIAYLKNKVATYEREKSDVEVAD